MKHWPAMTVFISIIAVTLVPPVSTRQKNVGPSGAGPRPNAVRPYVAYAAAMLATPPGGQQSSAKPFTQDQVQGMVRDGLGDETGAKAIEQRGIDFSPTEDFLQSLKTAGAVVQ